MRQQVLDACDRNRSAADVMNLLLWIHEDRRRQFPDDRPGSPRFIITMSVSRFEALTGLSRRSVQRALKLIIGRGFVKACHSTGYTNAYEVVDGMIEKYLQPMELFETGPVDTPPGVRMTPPPVSSWHPSPPHSGTPLSLLAIKATHQHHQGDDGQETDEEKDRIIEILRNLAGGKGVAKEQAEHWFTRYSRQLIVAGIDYVKQRCRNEMIDNPPGLLARFLQNPSKYGFEMNKQGCWLRSTAMQNQWRPMYENYHPERMKKETLDRVTTNK